jgi:predicted enzyme related to lactoylglutathione lyase
MSEDYATQHGPKKFYGEVFGWRFEDWSSYAGMPYFGAMNGDANEPVYGS